MKLKGQSEPVQSDLKQFSTSDGNIYSQVRGVSPIVPGIKDPDDEEKVNKK